MMLRTDLVERTLASPDRGVACRVAHAIALFRGRAATEHDKRSGRPRPGARGASVASS